MMPASQVYHIGTPSEHTTSEGFRSVVFQRFNLIFFFGHCCARHNDSGSHEDML